MQKLLLYTAVVFGLNLPFGYWRSNTRRFSLDWFLAVHLSVPVIVLLRWEFRYGMLIIPLSVLLFSLGQFIGAKLRDPIERAVPDPTSCLFWDAARLVWKR